MTTQFVNNALLNKLVPCSILTQYSADLSPNIYEFIMKFIMNIMEFTNDVTMT